MKKEKRKRPIENSVVLGKKGFNQNYWDENYSDPETMDGIINAKEHALYLKALFRVQGVKISRILDIGCGYGHLGVAMANTLKVKSYTGVEPSGPAFNEFKNNQLEKFKTKDAEIIKTELVDFVRSDQFKSEEIFDLSICSSVFQYLSEQDIQAGLKELAKKTRYLYLTTPTDKELDRQINELDFYDRYAIRRTKQQYLGLILPHFNIISYRLLESKALFDDSTTNFHDFLFRFE